jgi:hypothetical protein
MIPMSDASQANWIVRGGAGGVAVAASAARQSAGGPLKAAHPNNHPNPPDQLPLAPKVTFTVALAAQYTVTVSVEGMA